jgi:phosphate transport system protein
MADTFGGSGLEYCMLEVRQTFHDELAVLDQQIVQMGTITVQMVIDAVSALQESNIVLAEKVISTDDVVDGLDLDIEIRCMNLLALQQPVGRDLRKIGTALKVITDLERVGDHAVDIAKIARKFSHEYLTTRPMIDLGRLSTLAEGMVKDSLQALVGHDIELARQICADDDAVDAEFKTLREQLFDLSKTQSKMMPQASYLLLAVVYLERIADHATNIAERVHYVETGHLELLSRVHRLAANQI